MANWNELFKTDELVAKLPQPEIYRFIKMLEKRFEKRPLKIWDVCCGAGRHTALIAELGHEAYGSDNAPNALIRTENLLKQKGLTATLKLSDMTKCPWENHLQFSGALSWDAIHHNTLKNAQKAIDIIHDKLITNGLFIGVIKDRYDESNTDEFPHKEIEAHTIVPLAGKEEGVPHHYFDETEIRALFRKWEIEFLVRQQYTYVKAPEKYWKDNPFYYSTWGVIAKKVKA